MTELVQENKLDREKKAVDDMRETEEQDDSQQGWVEWITVHIFRNSFIWNLPYKKFRNHRTNYFEIHRTNYFEIHWFEWNDRPLGAITGHQPNTKNNPMKTSVEETI